MIFQPSIFLASHVSSQHFPFLHRPLSTAEANRTKGIDFVQDKFLKK